MRSDWHGLMKILEMEHIRDGRVIWSQKNVYNVFHTEGEKYFLDVLFAGTSVTSTYYIGLDNRTSLVAGDTLDDLLEEPTVNGYLRQSVTNSAFTVGLNGGIYRAVSPIVTFTATTGSWGPVAAVFLATSSNDTGSLLASAPLSQSLTLSASDQFNIRAGISLRDYPVS